MCPIFPTARTAAVPHNEGGGQGVKQPPQIFCLQRAFLISAANTLSVFLLKELVGTIFNRINGKGPWSQRKDFIPKAFWVPQW